MEPHTNPREEKGKEISKKYDQIKRIDDDHYEVQSQTAYFKWYNVISTESGWKCNCPDHTYRQICCKHIHAVEFSIKIREEIREKNRATIEPIACDKCPKCQSNNIVKHGVRHNKKYDLQRYSCKDCKNRFSFNLGFEKMSVNPKVITSALQLYFTGESLRNVQKFLRLQGVEISHKTVYVWIKKYTGLMEKYLEKLTPNVSDTWRADEIFIKVKGDMKYLFALMDDETRFLIAQEVADSKYMHNAENLLKMGKENAGKVPMTFITDGLYSYNEAFKRQFRTLKAPQPKHIRHITFNGRKHNNNKMERINGEIRDREKVMRGLKKKDTPVLTGYQIYHNYVRPHMALNGETPSEACGIKVGGDNKWLTLIQNASKKKSEPSGRTQLSCETVF